MVTAMLLGPIVCAESGGGAGRLERTVQVDGKKREYVVYLPTAAGTGPAPVVFVYHGAFSTAEAVEVQGRLHQTNRGRHYVVIYPEGFRRSWNAGVCCGPAKRREVDDVGFFDTMMQDLGRLVDIDKSRIYVTGFSNGAMMAYYLACERADRIAAIAPVSGVMQGVLESCRPSRAVPILHFHGKLDEWAPYRGGGSKWSKIGDQRPVSKLVEFWQERYQCKSERDYNIDSDADCRSYSECREGVEVTLCAVDGLGHQWPGHEARSTTVRTLGPANLKVRGSQRILEFFDRWALEKE